MMRKYEFTGDTKNYLGHTLHRIMAVRDFGGVKAGDLGGWIEKQENLSHEDNCWVYGNAQVYGDARVCGNAQVEEDARVCGNADIKSMRDHIVFKNWWSSGRYFTWTRSNDKWKVGCFYGSGEELVKKAYRDSELSGREYERIVKYVESIKKEAL